LVISAFTVPPASAAAPNYTWVELESNGVFEGVDGYIRASTTTPITSPSHRLDWVSLCTDGCADWVQVGEGQGYVHGGGYTFYSPNTEHMYYENNGICNYFNLDLGAPPSANYPYYIAYDGTRFVDACGHTEYEFMVKVGSWSSAPVAYGSTTSYAGQPYAAEELEWASGGTQPPSNTDFFGTDDAHNASGSKALHLTNDPSGAWYAWTTALDPTAFMHVDSNMSYTNKATWWAFGAS